MKSIFIAGLLLVALLAASFVVYGVYLNGVSDSYIEVVQSRRVVSVAASTAARRSFRPEITINGVNLQTEDITDVVCQVEGTLRNVAVRAGDIVKKGQIVCELNNPLLPLAISRSEAEVAKAEVSLRHFRIALERAERLRNERAISQSDLDTAQEQKDAAEAELVAARVTLNETRQRQAYLAVTSPIRGEVLIVYQKSGNHLYFGTPIMLIGNFETMTFSTIMADKEIGNLLPQAEEYEFITDLSDSSKGFMTKYSGGFYRDTAFKANIIDISPPLDQPTIYRNVRWQVHNHLNALEPGFYPDVVIRRTEPVTALLAPVGALVTDDGTSLFVMTPDGRLASRSVKTGRSDGESIEILAGIEEGDVIVESEVHDMKLGDAISAITQGE